MAHLATTTAPPATGSVRLTSRGRLILEFRAAELRDVRIPALLAITRDQPEDGSAVAEYLRALDQLWELELFLAHADDAPAEKVTPDLVEVGDIVTIEFVDTAEVERFVLVHPIEASLEHQRISIASPLGRALLGQLIGTTTKVDAPTGPYVVRVLATAASAEGEL